MSVALTGEDVSLINDLPLADLADGQAVLISIPNDLVGVKQGKNGNILYAFNATGRQCEATFRILRGSADDKRLNGLLTQYINNPSRFTLISGDFTKTIGDGAGNVTEEKYTMDGGVIQKIPEVQENVEGDTEQAVTVYMIRFGNVDRIMT
jgi:hypothetical protein